MGLPIWPTFRFGVVNGDLAPPVALLEETPRSHGFRPGLGPLPRRCAGRSWPWRLALVASRGAIKTGRVSKREREEKAGWRKGSPCHPGEPWNGERQASFHVNQVQLLRFAGVRIGPIRPIKPRKGPERGSPYPRCSMGLPYVSTLGWCQRGQWGGIDSSFMECMGMLQCPLEVQSLSW